MPKQMKRLTLKQKRFVVAYMGEAKGNATQAARIAGYSGKDNVLGAIGLENLKKPLISKEIADFVKSDPRIASRQDVLLYWTELLEDESAESTHRLRASENLARCYAMFIIRTKVEGTLKVDDTREALVKLIQNGAIIDQLERIEEIFLAETPEKVRPTSENSGEVDA